jgi:hypothetical protein
VTEGEEKEQWQEEGFADMDSNKQDYEYVTRTNTHTPQTQSSDSVTNVKSAHTALPKPINIPVANNKPVKIKSVREKVQFATNGNSTNKQEQIPTPTPTPAPKNGTKLLVCKMKVFGHTARVLIDGGSQGDFVASQFCYAKKLKTIRRKNVTNITLANGKVTEMCDQTFVCCYF